MSGYPTSREQPGEDADDETNVGTVAEFSNSEDSADPQAENRGDEATRRNAHE